ncbi:MAG: CdaR family protein [Clostridium sp.]
MKEKLTKNLGLKLLSLFCAFFVWLAVVNVANPARVDTKEVPVEIINTDVLERSNLTYEIVGKKTTVISYKVKTKDAYKIKPSDFRAYADLSEMYDVTGAIPIKVEILKNDELFQTMPSVKSPEVIKIKTEEVQTKRFEIQAKTYGSPSEGYVAGKITMNPDFVYVKGPISLVGQINSLGIEFNIEGTVADVIGTEPVIFYDANGNALTLGDSVQALNGAVEYNMQILKVKNLPLDFVVTGEVKEGYRYTGAECSVKNVPIAGLKSVLAPLSNITIQNPELNIEGATADKVCEIDLASYIDSNVQIAGMDGTKIKVILKVEPLQEKSYAINTKDITLVGKSDKYTYSMVNDKTDIRVRGLKEDLDSLSVVKMNLSVNVSDMTPGIHDAKVTLLLDDAYEIKEYPNCQIRVTVKEDMEPQSTETVKQAETTDAPTER